MQIVRAGTAGALALGLAPNPEPGPGDLLVQVAAAGVNRADLLQVAGRYPPPPGAPAWPGLEVSGTVLEVGDEARAGGWRTGDRVAALLAGGGYATLAAVPAALALRVPDEVELTGAAALPEALATVLSTLDAAGLLPGETLLVRGGSGGIGTVAVQLGRELGARVLATAGGLERCERVRELGVDLVVDHRGPDQVRLVREASGGGVDVVLDVVGAAALADNLAMLADGGRLAVIGLQRGTRAELDLATLLARRLTVLGTTLRSRPLAQKAAIMAAVRERAWPLVASGRVRPVIHARLPLARADEAHRLLAAGEAFGKVLLVP